ncbi:MAG: SDR family NAD(P)-dependent oxidoreductase [Verrucomicrobiales bacterium]|nr:SDR family NAD(P)-dependent oxidoreductase [Verrucomicrobiales bacterium]
MTLSLAGQTVAITGAARGIGLAIARSFLEAGADVLALDLDPAALAELQKEAPDRIRIRTVNVADLAALRQAVDDEQIDHVVCAAAIGSGKTGFPFWNLDPSDWARVLDVTLMGVVNTVHACVPALLKAETKRKSILILSSVAGQIGSQTDPPYSAAKAAVINFAQLAAKDFAPYGIRVNALSPGMVKTELNRAVFAASKEAATMSYEEWADEKIRRVSPLGRWQEASEFGALAVFLASDHARNLTGQTLNVDGGQVMHS